MNSIISKSKVSLRDDVSYGAYLEALPEGGGRIDQPLFKLVHNKNDSYKEYLTDEVIKKLHFTKCFVGADGFSVANGLTASDFDTARINQLVVAGSEERILLADTSKAGKASVIHYAPIESVDTLVTNKWLDSDIKAELIEKNINIIEA